MTLQRLRRYFQSNLSKYWKEELVERIAAQHGGKDLESMIGIVFAVKQHVPSGLITVVPGINIITTNGDRYYAQRAAAETPTTNFAAGGLRMGSSTTAPTKSDNDVTTFLAGTELAVDATYPRTSDPDTDNTGSGLTVVTWRFSYGTGAGNAAGIAEGAITNAIASPTSALTHFLFASSFTKTSSDTLKVFVNHTFLGV